MKNTIYSTHLKSPKWFEKRKTVLIRDRRKCKWCGSERNLQVHHRQYHISKKNGRFVKPWDYKLNHLVTLCKDCHERGHLIHKVPNFKI